MKLCLLAKAVILFSILSVVFDTYVFGVSIPSILANVFYMGLLVWITNWFCYSQSYSWVAWAIVGFTFIPVVIMPIVIKYRNSDPEIKQFVEEERASRGL